MSLSNSELLDAVRRLRSYMSTLDNIHCVLSSVKNMDDVNITAAANDLLSIVPDINMKVSKLLRLIESSRSYRDMAKQFRMTNEES